MGRRVVERDLSTREARKGLSVRAEPYWRNEGEGQHIGYYKGSRSKKWVARYRLPGSRGGYSKTTLGEADDVAGREADGGKVLSWKQAKAAAAAWFLQMDLQGGVRKGPYLVADALDDYMITFRGKDRSNTQRRIDKLIKPELGHYDTAKLSSDIIMVWHQRRAETPARLRSSKNQEQQYRKLDDPDAKRRRKSTANRDLTVLKAALNIAFHVGRIASDASWRRVKPFANVERARTRYLSDDEARRLVNACDPAFRPMVQASLLTGARYQEAARAKVGDFDPKAAILRIPESKSGAGRVSYLDPEGVSFFGQAAIGKTGLELLFPRPDGGKWGHSQQTRWLIQACLNGKISPRATFHDLRRTYGARLAIKGVPMAVIAEALGHKDERITRRHYAHLAPSYVADMVRTNVAGLGVFDKRDNIAGIAESQAR